jgi:hypothetical protein
MFSVRIRRHRGAGAFTSSRPVALSQTRWITRAALPQDPPGQRLGASWPSSFGESTDAIHTVVPASTLCSAGLATRDRLIWSGRVESAAGRTHAINHEVGCPNAA